MIEQYRKDMSEVHARTELIQRTKVAMKQEEERLGEKDSKEEGVQNESADHIIKVNSRIKRLWIPLSAAAAILILIAVPGVWSKSGTGTGRDIQTPARLGQADNNQPGFITNEPVAKGVTEVYEMPEEFENIKEIQKENVVYRVLYEKESDEWTAFIASENKMYLFTGEAVDEERFLQLAEAALKEAE